MSTRQLTSSNRARMMVIQCFMVVTQSGWHTDRMISPIPTAEFTSSLFSSTFFMNSCTRQRKGTHRYPQPPCPGPPCIHGITAHLMHINERLQSFRVIGQRSPEAEGLLGLREPLQQLVDGGTELLSLKSRSPSVSPPPLQLAPPDGPNRSAAPSQMCPGSVMPRTQTLEKFLQLKPWNVSLRRLQGRSHWIKQRHPQHN